MDHYFLLAQFFAITATCASLIAPQFKSERHLLMINIPAGLFWAIHFALMGGITGAIIATINVARNTTCIFLSKKFHKTAVTIAVSAAIIAGTLTWSGWYSVLPMIGASLTGLAYLNQDKHITLRLLMASSTSCWMVYEFTIGAYIAAVTSAFIVTSAIIGLARKYARNSNTMIAIPAE